MERPTFSVNVLLKTYAVGKPTADCFTVQEQVLPTVQQNELLLKTIYISVDPYQRGRIGDELNRCSSKPIALGAVMVGETLSLVLESKHPQFHVGDHVCAFTGWRQYSVVNPDDVEARKVMDEALLPKHLGVLGMTGRTAYHGLMRIGQPRAGETVVVSGAAGAVGNVVGQIAKIVGCRVVGIAGSVAKCRYLVDVLHFDIALNYNDPDFAASLKQGCPAGVDVYFDNTGGEISDQVLPLINRKARIAICGQIANYNEAVSYGPRLTHLLLWKSALMQGFLEQDFREHDEACVHQLSEWLNQGRLVTTEDILEGDLSTAVTAFLRLFDGLNFGKQLVKLTL